MDDLISRQAAIDAIISFFKLTDHNESAYAVRTVLGDLPPVTPKQAETECCADCKYDGYGRIGECARCCYSYASHFAHK